MTEDRPLHVRVAEALGLRVRDGRYECRGSCVRPIADGADFPSPAGTTAPHMHGTWQYWEPDWESGDGDGDWGPVPAYDTDWSTTGPPIEKYRIELTPPGAPEGESDWGATTWDPPANARGGEALVAVCNLLLLLHEAGKLREPK